VIDTSNMGVHALRERSASASTGAAKAASR
jgi:hypothetical protein